MNRILLFLCFVTGSQVFAAGAGIQMINWYEVLLRRLGMTDSHAIHEWVPVLGGLFSLVVLILVGLKFKKDVEAAGNEIIPNGKFNLRTFVEMILDFIYDLGADVIGKKEVRTYFTLLAGLFCFIFVSNLSGLVPGLPPATESLNTNLAMGLVVFLTYNIAGVKEHGAKYINQFMGPVWWLIPLIFAIELVSHLARPISLSLRLYGNIFGDHLVLSVFTSLAYVVVPAFLLFFGLLVASIQSFVFTLLSSIYISMAVSHDH